MGRGRAKASPGSRHSPSVPPRSSREPRAARGSRTRSSLPPGWAPALRPRGTSGTAPSPRAAARTATCGSGLRGQRCVSTRIDGHRQSNHLPSHRTARHPWTTIHVFQSMIEMSYTSIFSTHWDKWDDDVTEEYRTMCDDKYNIVLYILTYKMLQDPVWKGPAVKQSTLTQDIRNKNCKTPFSFYVLWNCINSCLSQKAHYLGNGTRTCSTGVKAWFIMGIE